MKKFGKAGLILLILLLIVGVGFGYQSRQKPKPTQNDPIAIQSGNMKLTSSAFENNQLIPAKYTCDGENINPSLQISEIPRETKSLVLIVDDPDAPTGIWVHWLVWNIKPEISSISENSTPEEATQGTNSFGKQNYGGPCPPSGTHHYVFKLYALDSWLSLTSSSDKKALEAAMKDHIVEQTELIGLYHH